MTKRKKTNCATPEPDYDNVPLCKSVKRDKGKEEEKPTSIIDEDHCDTDDCIQSGYSSMKFDWYCSDPSDTGSDARKMKKIDIGEETLWGIVTGYITSGIRCNTKSIRKQIFEKQKVKISTAKIRKALHDCLVQTYESYINSFRPIIELAESLLNSMYGGTVLSATSVDANNGMYPIAIYICREGRMKEWEKFLAIIPPLLKDTKRAITFFTTSRMASIFPLTRTSRMLNIFIDYVISFKGVGLKRVGNQVGLGTRMTFLPVVRKWRRNGRLWKDERIVPRASAKLGDQILHKRLYHASSRPVWRNNFINLVTNICNKPSRNVNLLLRTCDYGKWQISGVPCVHDVAVIAQHRHRPPFYEKYVDEYFIVGKYMASYAGIIYQTPGMTESLQVAGINPPPLKNIIHLS
ncbi:hypothetical protein C5167_014319 [Papaver somniferum]|uniref:Zinc finger PMZ-type domain-containing protein n=1 Tax=Papaver somniferum TaxID=3469 RepID=A0A4Y7J2V9_PAPSO|nr:hypothetical protein C5167_014319 [Papaver somniferum]